MGAGNRRRQSDPDRRLGSPRDTPGRRTSAGADPWTWAEGWVRREGRDSLLSSPAGRTPRARGSLVACGRRYPNSTGAEEAFRVALAATGCGRRSALYQPSPSGRSRYQAASGEQVEVHRRNTLGAHVRGHRRRLGGVVLDGGPVRAGAGPSGSRRGRLLRSASANR